MIETRMRRIIEKIESFWRDEEEGGATIKYSFTFRIPFTEIHIGIDPGDQLNIFTIVKEYWRYGEVYFAKIIISL